MHTQLDELVNAYGMDCSNIPHPPLFTSPPVSLFGSVVLRLPNLRDMLTKASISYPPKEMETCKIMPNHCTRSGKCTYCPIIRKIDNVTCTITGKIHNTIDLPKHITCELCDIVYLITCTKCNKYYVSETGRPFRSRIYEHKLSVTKPKDSRITPVSKHFTGKGHPVRNMQFSVLEWCLF